MANFVNAKTPDLNAVKWLKDSSYDELAEHLLKYSHYLQMSSSQLYDMDKTANQDEMNEIRQYQVNLVKWSENIQEYDTVRNALLDKRPSYFSHSIYYLKLAIEEIVKRVYKMDMKTFIAKYEKNKNGNQKNKQQEFTNARQKLLQDIQKIDFSKMSDTQLKQVLDVVNSR